MEKVCVLMSTYNGEKYLEKQIESILNQKGVEVKLIVRDDGSSDNTIEILRNYAKSKKIFFYKGKNLGPAGSFMSLLNSDFVKLLMSQGVYIAFSDQDDIWKSNKLSRAIEILKTPDYKNVPAIYTCNFQLINQSDDFIENINHIVTTNFLDSLIISSCTGCTMVFNYNLYKELENVCPENIYMHDDWIHKVCLALGGKVFFDRGARNVFYRQHENNVIGLKTRFFSKISSYLDFLTDTRYKDRMLNEYKDINKLYNSKIPSKNSSLIKEVLNYKNLGLISRINFANKICKKAQIKSFTRDFRLAIFFKRY